MTSLKWHFPICFLSDRYICTYKSGNFYIVDLQNHRATFLTSFNIPIIERVLSNSKLLNRLLRYGVRYGKIIDFKDILFVHNKKIYKLDIENKLIEKEHNLERGNRPLSMVKIHNLMNFDDGVYFGEYYYNPNKLEVNILKRKPTGIWEIVACFAKGTINHIHSIVSDHFNGCAWILTGDTGNSAGIWLSNDGFRTIKPVLLGNQNYRTCVAFPTEQGLLYATDTPFSQNSIRIVIKSGEKWISEKLCDIDGPVLQGCKISNNFVFSTMVEGSGTEKGLEIFYRRKRGPGIKEPMCHIYSGNIQNGFRKIHSQKKDPLPFFFFQFGVILFPEGNCMNDTLPFYTIALLKNDQSLNFLKVED